MDNNGNQPRYQEVDFNSSNYFNMCWMKINSQTQLNDTSFAYSDVESITAGFFIALESIIGAFLNFIVILALVRSSDLRKEYLTPTIVSIAITDFLFSVIALPVLSLLFFMSDMPLTSITLYSFISYGLWFSSAWNLLGVSILRYIAVFYPKITKKEGFQRSVILIPVMAWIIPFLFLVPTLIGKYGQFGLECKTLILRFIPININGNPTAIEPETFMSGVMGIVGILVFLLNIATYAQISRKLQDLLMEMTNNNLEATKRLMAREKSVGIMVAIVSVSFFLVYFPTIVLRWIDQNASVTKTTATIICYLINWSIGIIDPLIYMICRKNYRDEIKCLLKS